MYIYEKTTTYNIIDEVETFIIDSPNYIFKLLKHRFNPTREDFFVIALNAKNEVIIDKLFSGTINKSTVYTKEVFRFLLDCNAVSCAIAHNHPSGELTPSREDKQLTTSLYRGIRSIGMELVDHVIFSHTDFCSLREHLPELFTNNKK